MIETPRAALVADRIAEVAEFFSFGTNDLTQMTFGFSRDDIEGRFMARVPRATSCCRRTRSRRSTSKASASSCAWAARRARATRADIEARYLRRARRRSRVGRVLSRGRPRLRVVLAVPRADRPPRRRARRARHRRPRRHRLRDPVCAVSWAPGGPNSAPKQWRDGEYLVTTDPARFDSTSRPRFSSTTRTGSPGRTRASRRRLAAANSRCYSVLHEPSGAQVGGCTRGHRFRRVRMDRRRLRRARGARQRPRQVPDAVHRPTISRTSTACSSAPATPTGSTRSSASRRTGAERPLDGTLSLVTPPQ